MMRAPIQAPTDQSEETKKLKILADIHHGG